jgi:hypothetical protein
MERRWAVWLAVMLITAMAGGRSPAPALGSEAPAKPAEDGRQDARPSMLTKYLEHYPNLSETLAGQLLDETLSLEEARSKVGREYVSRFRKVLPDRAVARFFQIERKLDAVVNAELAERVPLVE